MEDTSGNIRNNITYKSLIDRGFNRIENDDEVHFDERGYDSFLLLKEFEFSKVEFCFDEIELNVSISTLSDDGTIIDRKVLITLSQLDFWLNEIDSLEQILKFSSNKLKELFK